jgi:hypothetical protein
VSSGVPYLSVVVTSRNDGHGGNPLARFQAFINCLIAQCRRTGLHTELIIVEWNPPVDQPRLSEVLAWPDDSPCDVRFVEVPESLHSRLKHADRLPLFQMIAKNVGIRRARGQFVLSTNIDVLLSNELVNHIAAGKLESHTLYRIDRCDVDADVPIDAPLDEMLRYCRSHQLRRHTRRGTFPVTATGTPALFAGDIVAADAGIVPGEGWHSLEGAVGAPARWACSRAELRLDDTIVSGTLNLHCEPDPFGEAGCVELRVVDDRGQVLLAPVTLSSEQTVQVAVPRGITRRLWIEAVNGGAAPDSLPLFEYRDDLRYRIRRVWWNTVERTDSVIAAPDHSYPLDAWQVSEGSQTTIMPTRAGVEVTADSRKWAYAVELGPLAAPDGGTYRFEIKARVHAGKISGRALSGDRTHWIADATAVVMSGGEQSFLLTLTLERGQSFFLVLSNATPHEGVLPRFLLSGTRGDRAYADLCLARTPPRSEPRLRRLLRKLSPGESQQEPSAVEGQPSNPAAVAVNPLAALEPFYRFFSSVRPDPIHTHACGDFQLLSKEDWFNLRGYPELEMFSMNVDELFSHVAHYAGLGEQVFADPMCAYHIEHAAGSGWTPEGAAALRSRIQASGIEWLDHDVVTLLASYMKFLRRPMIFNGDEWGLARHQLSETTPTVTHHGV